MKSFSALLLSLLIVLLVAACSDNPTAPEEPEFEPYTNGNWLVTSPHTARLLIDNQQKNLLKSSSDTVKVKKNVHDIRMIGDSTSNGDLKIIFTDSSLTIDDVDSLNVKKYGVDFESRPTPLVGGGYGVLRTPDYVEITIYAEYYCGTEYTFKTMYFLFQREDYSVIHAYEIDVAGMGQTIIDTACD